MNINVLEYLEEAARKFPTKIALEDENDKVTYQEYLEKAKAIGSFIIDSGVCDSGKCKPIAVVISRNIKSIIAFMGCVYSGNFYVPLDATMPSARIELILETLKPAMIINASKDKVAFSDKIIDYTDAVMAKCDNEALTEVRERHIDTDPLYSIFTSGSTGIPKGVLISHRGVIDLIEQFEYSFSFDHTQVFANQAPFDFDVSVKDIYNSIKQGATLIVVPKRLFMTPKLLVEYLNEKSVDTMIWAVSALRILADLDILSKTNLTSIRYIMFSGEAMPVKTLKYLQRYLADTMFVNLYGPTEITCNCTYYIVPDRYEGDKYVPIGKAFRNTRVFLLNKDGAIVSEKETIGEICVTGSCLALGYYNDQAKTEDSFQNNQLIREFVQKAYHTGDMGYYDADGQMVFVSRKDSQIKHMGHRIELGEIEAVLNNFSGIRVGCCLFDEEQKEIVCFYESENECKKEIVLYLKSKLPKYMWPNKYEWREKLPQNRNGKIDRVRLKKEWSCNEQNN